MSLMLVFVGLIGGTDIYRFDPAANRFLDILYPAHSLPSPPTQAFIWGRNVPRAAHLDELLQLNVAASFLASGSGMRSLDLGPDKIDSYWWVARFSPKKAVTFLKHCTDRGLLALLDQLAHEELIFGSLLEKVLFQRDVYQVFCLFHSLQDMDLPNTAITYIQDIRFLLRTVWPRLLLSRTEVLALRADYPAEPNPQLFRSRFLPRDPRLYLPAPVHTSSSDWVELPFYDRAPKHFIDYQGRSFIRVYIKTPGMDRDAFLTFWRELNDLFGEGLHLNTTAGLPPMTETLLVRSIGTFCQDGTYVDTRIVENVLMRVFKYAVQRLDMTTSDYRGMYLLSYTLQRRRLLDDPTSLGLVEDDLDSPAYFGFLSTAPDLGNAYSDSLTTVRFNCISCHSELHYGPQTVFSLSRMVPQREGSRAAFFNELLLKTGEENFFFLNTKEFRSISTIE